MTVFIDTPDIHLRSFDEDCGACQELVVEAWERMTFGGVQVNDRALMRWHIDCRIFIPVVWRVAR